MGKKFIIGGIILVILLAWVLPLAHGMHLGHHLLDIGCERRLGVIFCESP